MNKCLILILLDEGKHTLIWHTERETAEEPFRWHPIGILGRWLDAGIEVLNDVRGEHLEVKEEMLLATKDMEVSFRAV